MSLAVNIFKQTNFWECLGGSAMVIEGPEGSGRVSEGPEGSEWVKKGPGKFRGSTRFQEVPEV